MRGGRARRREPIDERAFHRWLARSARPEDGPVRALADDVASLPVGKGTLLLTTDAFCEGVHFRPESPPRLVGRALAEANLSDLASKGAAPLGFLLDLLVPPGTPARWARDVVRGVRDSLRPYRVELLGGDTKPAARPTLVGTALGWVASPEIPARHRARPGDLVVVTGVVGRGGRAGLALGGKRRLLGREARALLEVRARVREGARLAPFVHAMTDTSDGVLESAHLIAEASRTKLLLDPETLPLDPELRRRVRSPTERLRVAGFGGDYELFATMDPQRLLEARRALGRLRCPLTVIGSVRSGRGAFWQGARGESPLPLAGWDPFRTGSAALRR